MAAFDMEEYWRGQMADHAATLALTQNLLPDFEKLIPLCAESLQSGGKLLFLGNGGSAADAQHLATELTIRFCHNRRALAALALTTDTSTLTAAGNDLGFESIFARQIEALGKPEDVVIALSTSGNSPNVLAALKTAAGLGLRRVGFAGRDGGAMRALCDLCLIVPADDTARIQEMHILLGHMLCGGLERHLGLLPEIP